jgi:CBS domain-containing protein
MKVSQIMTTDVESCAPEDNLAAAACRMWDCDIGSLPVVDANGQVVGMVTDRDICMAALTRGQPLHHIPVSVAMSKDVLSCSPDATLSEAEEIMRSGQVRRLPAIDSDACLAGIVSLNDLARLAEREVGRKNRGLGAQEVAATLAAVCQPRRIEEQSGSA